MAAVLTACLLPPSPEVAKLSENLPKEGGRSPPPKGQRHVLFFPGHSLEGVFLHQAEEQADYMEIIRQSQICCSYLIAVPGFLD